MNNLNPFQKLAVETLKGPVRIIAGAGTGKTHTLIVRIARLIQNGVKPERILALTFTNKAAHEILDRLKNQGLTGVQAITFHALAARLLRKYWREDFRIVENMPPEGSIPACRQARRESSLQGKSETLLTFDELLTTLLNLWKEKPHVLMLCQMQFEQVMVDEYQDVNVYQIEIVRRLAESHHNLCIVGDPDQTIYSWRGSVPTSMKEFEALYPEAKTITLTENYRNPPVILRGAEALIRHNPDRFEKNLIPVQRKETQIHHWQAKEDGELREMIKRVLQEKVGSYGHMHEADAWDAGKNDPIHPLSDIAILYRTQEEGRRIAAWLGREGYPYTMSAPESFWERAEIRTFLDQLRILQDTTIAFPQNNVFGQWIRQAIDQFITGGSFLPSQTQRLYELIAYAMAFDALPQKEALQAFLDEITLQQEADNLVENTQDLRLLTLHAAKGLEFPIVLIVGLKEGSIPHHKTLQDPEKLAEERRLLYVGMTRATQELHLFGMQENPSRFIAEIGALHLTAVTLPTVKVRQIKKRAIKKAQMKMF